MRDSPLSYSALLNSVWATRMVTIHYRTALLHCEEFTIHSHFSRFILLSSHPVYCIMTSCFFIRPSVNCSYFNQLGLYELVASDRLRDLSEQF